MASSSPFQQIFDYAGLFPPAGYAMDQAVAEYFEHVSGPEEFLVNRFLLPAGKEAGYVQALDPYNVEGTIPISLIVSGAEPGALDSAYSLSVGQYGLAVDSVEYKIPVTRTIDSVVKELAKSTARDELGSDVFIEFDRSKWIEEDAEVLVREIEVIGLKFRTGGLTASDFPTSQQLARAIFDAVSLGVSVKFTAGLHQPLRHTDALGFERHGFANVLAACVLADQCDLAATEIESILEAREPAKFEWTSTTVKFGGWDGDLTEAEWFGGIGSCSIAEPYEALQKLGW